MKYYPVFMDIKDKNCLVVGGGSVGMRKAVTLEKCNAKVKVISRQFADGFDNLETVCIEFKKKDYEKKDLNGMFFVFAATDNSDLNQRIKNDAAKLNILCNIADSPDKSDFILPSIVQRGNLILAVSTCGSSPAMAKKIRQELEHSFGHEYVQFLTLMENIRKERLISGHASHDNREVFHTIIDKGILELIKEKDEKKIDSILRDVLGEKYSYKNLVSKDFISWRSDK
ncbi:MAG: bifunctional precorrin-2 dehydrogenase/sirohydrochlorin ferrochelatase [Desulfobacula sp.]|nr:bifunctional precorrin-2 dehydrogenase/sirohydrochlorin ferrochelatase [Desulfobacula sp.]